LESSDAIFTTLQQDIIKCRLCPRLVEWRERIAREKAPRFRTQEYWGRPLPAFGDPNAALVIIGLAPAAHGGNRTGRMFTGDRSGDWLYEVLHRFGFANQPSSLHRNDGLRLINCLITAAVRCAPPNNKPLPSELDNCRRYLRHELKLTEKKRVIVVLGQIALRALLKVRRESGDSRPVEPIVFRHGGEWELSGRLTLISSYHPSQQNTQTGRLTRPMFSRIFERARAILDQDQTGSRI
jgi:uracil-DNA glycosylase